MGHRKRRLTPPLVFVGLLFLFFAMATVSALIRGRFGVAGVTGSLALLQVVMVHVLSNTRPEEP